MGYLFSYINGSSLMLICIFGALSLVLSGKGTGILFKGLTSSLFFKNSYSNMFSNFSFFYFSFFSFTINLCKSLSCYPSLIFYKSSSFFIFYISFSKTYLSFFAISFSKAFLPLSFAFSFY